MGKSKTTTTTSIVSNTQTTTHHNVKPLCAKTTCASRRLSIYNCVNAPQRDITGRFRTRETFIIRSSVRLSVRPSYIVGKCRLKSDTTDIYKLNTQ